MTRTTKIALIGAAVFALLLVGSAFAYTRIVRPALVRSGIGLPGHSWVMEGQSMAPTLPKGTRFSTRPPGTVQRGDIVTFIMPDGSDRVLVKRVIGVAGDRVAVRRGVFYVNGEPLEEPVAPSVGFEVAERVVAPGSIWVVGDNPGQSLDSRAFGDVPLDQVRGIVNLP